MDPKEFDHIRNITVSGRIGSGATTLATHLANHIGWEVLDGGKLFRSITNDHGFAQDRSDTFDIEYEDRIKNILQKENHHIIQSHLAGFDAQGIDGVLKIFVVCEDEEGHDKADVRIDRLVNRDGMAVEEAKFELKERDKQNLTKWRRLYANDDQEWVYWDKKYYDLIVNTFQLNQHDALKLVLERLGI